MSRRIRNLLTRTTLLLLTLAWAGGAIAADFPLRAKYPQLTPISTTELDRQYDQAVIVDVRSAEEYGVIHIAKALHIPVAQATFTKDLEKARGKTDAAPLVMYCNGVTCAKSYKACQQARDEGFRNVFVYDAGVFDWVSTFPERGTLMGASPAPKEKIIPKAEFKKHFIDYATFQRYAQEPNVVTIDIRDPFQREVIPPVAKLRNIPMDRLAGLLESKRLQGDKLLFVDAVGKQVRWLQYHLEANGYSNYYFLNDGVRGI